MLGLVRAESLPEQLDQPLDRLQHALFAAMAELAAVDPAKCRSRRLTAEDVKAVERAIDQMQHTVEPLGQFILPTGTRAAAGLHVARTVCRRAERRLVALARHGETEVPDTLLAFVNRLSDLLFVLARAVNAQAGYKEVPWRKDG